MVNQHCVSISKILVTEFVTVKVSWNLNLNQHGETYNLVGTYVLSKVMECLEQNIRKQVDFKNTSNTKQINRVQNIGIDICK